ncbi:superoxide dismutase family protein [Jiulongibacter sediminis]|jgi:Cu-Zn family superoxide dismutase|uniref:superoxide dismutase family protein n=1 Tax=Jiulongibacter sediminis TaxID=1605367 RepID=UPI0026E985C8|nr:superoxide dismutase family protein [Jiulongibacter sediminis]
MKKLLMIVLAGGILMACNNTVEEQYDDNVPTEIEAVAGVSMETAVADIEGKSDMDVSGTVAFTEADGMVTMEANIIGLPKGKHAIHIHETGDCSAVDGKSAGGHWNPTGVDHGQWRMEPHHAGDIGNLESPGDSITVLSLTTDKWCLSCDDENKNILNKAIIIHAGPDDFTSQPSGAAGARVGCGVIDKDEIM